MRLAILSHSARIYTQIAQQEGFRVLAVDAFSDADTRQAAQAVYQWPGLCEQPPGDNRAGLFAALDAFQPEAVLVGSGFEADLASYHALFERYVVLGNLPETVGRVKNPQWLKACCDALRVQSPPIAVTQPATGQWLYKQAGQCGGSHVQHWRRGMGEVEHGYWQALQPGQAIGILFLAHAQSATLIGVHTLRQRAGSYVYAGATRLHDDYLHVAANTLLQALVPALGLVGINSIDTIWHEGRLHVIEVNPRLSASMRLYMGQPLMQAHLDSCLNKVVPVLQQPKDAASHCIMYARQTIDVSQLSFPDWLEDRPGGGNITAGQPVCSIYAKGQTDREVQQALLDKKTRLEKLWGTYVCDNIEFNIH